MADPPTYQTWLLQEKYRYARAEVLCFEETHFTQSNDPNSDERTCAAVEVEVNKRQANLDEIERRMEEEGVPPPPDDEV